MAPVLHATVLDVFDSTTPWTVSADEGSTLAVSTATGESGQALALQFKLGRGRWAGVSKDLHSPVNFTGLDINAVRFFYKAQSHRNTIEFKLTDSDFLDPGDSTKAVLKFPAVADGQWHEVLAPLQSFETWKDTGLGGDTDSATFDWTAVSHVSYGVSLDTVTLRSDGFLGSDTILFDDISFYHLDAPVSLVNNFENAVPGCSATNTCANDRPAPENSGAFPFDHPEWGSSVIVSSTASSGAHSREIRYTLNGGGFYGFYEVLEIVSVLPTDRVEFDARGVAGNEPLRVQVKSSNQTASPYATVNLPQPLTTGWQSFSIPFSSLAAVGGLAQPLDLNAVSEIIFLFEHSGTNKSGVVYVDNIRIVRPGAVSNGAVVSTWDDFSSDKGGYKQYVRDDPVENTNLKFSFDVDESINGQDNKVGRLDYDFLSTAGDVPYAVVERGVGINLLAEPAIRLRYKGVYAVGNIEIRLTDADGTMFKKTLYNGSDSKGQWKSVTVPIDQFSFSWQGSDNNLNLDLLSQIGVFLAPGETGAGTLMLDTLEIVKQDSLSKTDLGGLLSSVVTPDNPFSPNGDGLKDEFTVNFELEDAARVVFRVFSLQGVPVRSIDLGSQPAGANVITWDGRNEEGDLLANGIYFFVLEAKSDFSGDQTFRQVVGIAR